ncbi:VWA domain-containing protein [Streptomyces sp. NPDC051940]|uniref:VWA domain-containing protein n=1 Tax=Streptomyces sp. NPDC051940 TaxID=3155675 RepID=UPI003443450A
MSQTTGSAISLEKVRQTAPGLVSLYKTAGDSLARYGLQGQRAAVYLVLDYSGSMKPYYDDGTVQHLAEQVLGLCAHLDDDGVVPVVFFSTGVDEEEEIALDDYTGRIGRIVDRLGHMGRTNYHWGMDAVLDHYLSRGGGAPALVVFQTDGGPTSKLAAEKFLCKSAELPLFWQFVGFGQEQHFRFLRRMDELSVPQRRIVDNAGFFYAGDNPRKTKDRDLFDRLLSGYPQWLADARRAGILT